MPARIVIKGRSVWGSPELRQRERARARQHQSLPLGRKGTPHEGQVLSPAGVPADSPASPYRAGIAFECPEDRVTYRIVLRLDPREGWATSDFWQERWRCRHVDVLRLVERGLLDAAMEQGSQVRRYRCRDERMCLGSPVLRNEARRRAEYRERFKGKRKP